MADAAFLSTLKSQRTIVLQELEKVQARLDAINLVIKEFSTDAEPQSNGNGVMHNPPPPISVSKPPVAGVSRNRDGYPKTIRDNFSELPAHFTRHDVEALLLRHFPELETKGVNKNTMPKIMKGLVSSGLASIGTPGSGTIAQIYQKN